MRLITLFSYKLYIGLVVKFIKLYEFRYKLPTT